MIETPFGRPSYVLAFETQCDAARPVRAVAPAFAQTICTGAISGTVTDDTSAVVPGVKISATNMRTGIERNALTNANGFYVIPTLQFGTYRVKAIHQGFKTVTQEDVRLETDTVATVNISLTLGSTEQSITVTEAPPAIQTASGEMGTIATGAQVSELSFNGRNFSQILTLGTGIASQNTGHRSGRWPGRQSADVGERRPHHQYEVHLRRNPGDGHRRQPRAGPVPADGRAGRGADQDQQLHG
jgi:hypothetical protein